MTQPMEPQTLDTFCDALIAALPDPRLIRGHDYLSATWTTASTQWDLTVDTTVAALDVSIDSARSYTKLRHVEHADLVITMLRALGAIPPETFTVDLANITVDPDSVKALGRILTTDVAKRARRAGKGLS